MRPSKASFPSGIPTPQVATGDNDKGVDICPVPVSICESFSTVTENIKRDEARAATMAFNRKW